MKVNRIDIAHINLVLAENQRGLLRCVVVDVNVLAGFIGSLTVPHDLGMIPENVVFEALDGDMQIRATSNDRETWTADQVAFTIASDLTLPATMIHWRAMLLARVA